MPLIKTAGLFMLTAIAEIAVCRRRIDRAWYRRGRLECAEFVLTPGSFRRIAPITLNNS